MATSIFNSPQNFTASDSYIAPGATGGVQIQAGTASGTYNLGLVQMPLSDFALTAGYAKCLWTVVAAAFAAAGITLPYATNIYMIAEVYSVAPSGTPPYIPPTAISGASAEFGVYLPTPITTPPPPVITLS